jgi:hypothetical protein
MKTNFVRFFAALMLLALAVLSLPTAVHADGSNPNTTVDIVSVKPGVSVTIRGNNFPGGLFTVKMDKAGGQAANGVQVDVTNTGNGGSFQETYKIPDSLKNESRVTIRLEKGSVYAYNTFTNQASTSPTPTPVISSGTPKPSISIIGVTKNDFVIVRAEDFPANTTFSVRVGPYYSFFRDSVTTGTINSGKGGTFDFRVELPSVVDDVEMVTVRLDGGGKFAYNAFKNVTGGTTSVTSTPASGSYACSIVSVLPTSTVKPSEDFDAVWELKNTSSSNWEASAVDYKFISGAALHEKSIYDLKTTVKPGETIKVIVDMHAPTSKGTYSESWSLVQGSKTLCAMSVSMTVK